MNIDTLNQEFGIDDYVSFDRLNDEGIIMDITNARCVGRIAMQGAHLVHWQPVHSSEPVIWLSQQVRFARGKSIRGGIPVCWPWFGAHESHADFPAHGYARTSEWEMISTKLVDDLETEIQFRLIEDERTRSLWPYPSECMLTINAADTLRLTLTTENRGEAAFVLGEALHTYFAVGDIEHVKVTGLQGCRYYDKVADARGQQEGDILFSGETDRVYMDTHATCTIEDDRLQRRIVIRKSASESTVVWNPWRDRAEAMGDLGPEGWRHMLCVESANAMDNRVTVQPGETHSIVVEYSVENL